MLPERSSGGAQGLSWARLARSWSALGTLLGALEVRLGRFNAFLDAILRNLAFFSRFFSILEGSLEVLGGFLRSLIFDEFSIGEKSA